MLMRRSSRTAMPTTIGPGRLTSVTIIIIIIMARYEHVMSLQSRQQDTNQLPGPNQHDVFYVGIVYLGNAYRTNKCRFHYTSYFFRFINDIDL